MKLRKTTSLLLIIAIAFFMLSCDRKEQSEKEEQKSEQKEQIEQEREVTVEEVPAEVLQVFNETYPGATIKEYSEEIEDSLTFYEISFEFEGRKIDAVYKPDGQVEAIEEIISAEQLPEAVQEAISNTFTQFTIEIAEKIETEGKNLFEVVISDKDSNKIYEIVYSDSGAVVGKELKKEIND
ncbi:PepSY-like domain-containing protein [Bacteroidota bacterium]